MGWSLMAGGYITRTVRGICDELCGSDNIGHGFYYHSSKMKTLSNSSFSQMTRDKLRGDDYFELVADEFSFSFCGYSGTFYYNENGGWTVVSDDAIKVEFNPTLGEGFIDLKTLEKRFITTGWKTRSHYNRFFNKFTLVTPDGCRYEFGGLDATEYSAPYYSRGNNGLTATTWRLKKIITVDKRVIEFRYDTSSKMCDIRYVPQYREVFNSPHEISNPLMTGWRGFTGFILFPVNLVAVTTPNEILTFSYFKEQGYGDRFYRGSKALYWNYKSDYTRYSPYSDNMENPYEQFHVFMDVSILQNEDATRMAIANKLTHLILEKITIENKNSDKSKSVYFGYTSASETERQQLYSIAMRADSPELADGADAGLEDDYPVYRFRYNKNKKRDGTYIMPYRYSMAYTDSWGYCRGGEVSISENPSFPKCCRTLNAQRLEHCLK